LSLLKVVITGLDPVIHAFWRRSNQLAKAWMAGSSQIKSGHDDWWGGHIVADEAETTITLTEAPDDDESAVIAEGLRAYNEAQAGYSDSRALAVLVRDPETKKVVGGLLGRTSLGLLRVELFFLPEDLRHCRLGSRILAMAEEEGRRRGCTRAVLSTVHFQAPGFYLKQGWEVAARIECEPPGHTRFYMTKKLS
jgi:GNAT superfamily N-acetyltransferase